MGNSENTPASTSRRTVLKAGAWSVPVVASRSPRPRPPGDWRMIETGQTFSANTSSSGFARVDTPPSGVVTGAENYEITALDARKVIVVQATGPV